MCKFGFNVSRGRNIRYGYKIDMEAPVGGTVKHQRLRMKNTSSEIYNYDCTVKVAGQ